MAEITNQDMRVEKNILIPMGDDVKLAGDLYSLEWKRPVPCLITYYPYHKDDFLIAQAEYMVRHFVENEYACLLVDLRGTGSSEGLTWEMNDPKEFEDGAAVVEWSARQPWCNGNVGMWGMSYGGATTLGTAAQQPSSLKAIASMIPISDLYRDFIYPGGCLNCLSAFGLFGNLMVAYNLMPPGYQDPEGRWYRIWKDRLENVMNYMLPWQDRPTRDDYWQPRAIPVDDIEVPTFLIGGWRDLFPEVVRTYERISAPKKLIMGPWTHVVMDQATIEPLDFLHELTRWWDYWLKGDETGIVNEPPITIFVQGANEWRHEKEWPIQRTDERLFYLRFDNTLVEETTDIEESVSYETNPTIGTAAGLWDPNGIGLALDQGPDDLLALTFTSEPLEFDLEITGPPEANLFVTLESGKELNLVVKLNDVGPDGRSSLITTGWLKGSHHRSHERPEPLKTGDIHRFSIHLWNTSYLIPKGNRIRLSVSCSDFPRIWPTKTNPEIRLFFGGRNASTLRIPVVRPQSEVLPTPTIRQPDPSVDRVSALIDGALTWKIERDLVEDAVAVITGSYVDLTTPDGMRIKTKDRSCARVAAVHPEGARVDLEVSISMDIPAVGEVIVESTSNLSKSRMLTRGKITMNGRLFFEKVWRK